MAHNFAILACTRLGLIGVDYEKGRSAQSKDAGGNRQRRLGNVAQGRAAISHTQGYFTRNTLCTCSDNTSDIHTFHRSSWA